MANRPNWAVISAVNNPPVLKSCLLSSPDVAQASQVILQRGYPSAALAYNAALEKASGEVLVFAHQDVFLPEGWWAAVRRAIEAVAKKDPEWAVLGVWGVKQSGDRAGHIYCAGLRKVLGEPFEGGREVRTLDEVLLVLRRASRLRFDERLGGFHLYGTDLCLEAARRGLKCYAISAFCLHNTNGYNLLPLDFWRAYWFLRGKWRTELPVITPCAEITAWGWPALRWNLIQAANILLGRHQPGKRVGDPRHLHQRILEGGPEA